MKKNFLILLLCCQLFFNETLALTFNSLTPAETFTITGNAASDYFGYSVSSAGDIDNDGYEDIIVGAYYKNSQKGAAYMIYGGKTSSMSNIDLSTTTLDLLTTGFMISGNTASDDFGYSVSNAGDINKDGYDDVLVGAMKKNSYQGAAYVIYGGERSSMSNIDLSQTTFDPFTTGFMITGNAVGDYLGCSVRSLGDIDNDGYDDIIVGAYYKNSLQGAAYVIYGGEKSSMSNIDLRTTTLDPLTTGFTLTGSAISTNFGWAVSSAGDIDNDGYDDIVIGASADSTNGHWSGAVYVIYGRERSSMSNLDFSAGATLNPATTGFMVTGNAGSDRLGYAVSNAGDINNDGYSDIIISAYGKNTYRGAVYIIYGGKKSSMSNIDLSSVTLDPLTTGFTISGSAQNCYFGASVSSAGDINKDGYDEIVIGAYGINSNMGAAYVIYGGEKSSFSNIDLSSETLTNGFSISGTTANGYLGGSVRFVDINNDGFSEVLVGAYKENKAYILMYNECPENCDQCDSTTECKVCEAGYGLNSQKLCEACTPANCETCNTDYTYCETCSSSYLVYSGECMKTCPLKTFTSGTECEDCPEECSKCTDASTCQSCIDGYTLTKSQCKKTETKTEVIEQKGSEKAAAGVFEGASIVGSTLSSGSSLSFNFGLVAKILRNIKYMKLPVSSELFETFVSWKVASGFLSAPGSWSEKYSAKTMPTVFSRYELQAAFLINFWKPLMMTLIGVAVFGVFKLIETNIKNKKNKVYEISKQVNVAASNFALTQFYSNLDDVLFYFILEMRSTKFETLFRICSSALAIILFLVGAAFMIMHSQILGKYQKLKEAKSTPQLKDFVAKFVNVNLIFKDFKDTNSLTQSFLMLNIGRCLLSSLIFATLFEYPMIQISFLIVLSLLMIFYLWNLKSFQEFSNTCSQMFCEVVLFVANICVFLLALFDHADYYPVSSIERIGKCIIALNLILLFGSALLIAVNVGKILYQVYKNKKNLQKASQQAELSLSEGKMISTAAKFNRPVLTQSNQNFSTNLGELNDPQKSFQFQLNQHQLTLQNFQNNRSLSNKSPQPGILKNYSIYHPARNPNPPSSDVQMQTDFDISIPNPGFQSSPFEEIGSQFNISSNRTFPRSRLVINREITRIRIAEFSQRKNNSNNGNPEIGSQDSSFHSRMLLNQSMSQDVSLTNFE